MPQAVGCDTRLPLGDTELLQGVVEPAQIALEVQGWIAHVRIAACGQ